jgi:hypothetical protein
LARCWVQLEASGHCPCCLGGFGEAGGAGERSWRVRKEGRALRAEEVWLGVWGEVGWRLVEAGAAVVGVV